MCKNRIEENQSVSQKEVCNSETDHTFQSTKKHTHAISELCV